MGGTEMGGIVIIILSLIQSGGSFDNRFIALYNKADSAFNNRYNIEDLRRVSEEAAKKADEKTKHLQPEIPKLKDLIGDSLIYEFDKIHEFFNKKEYGRKTNRHTIWTDDLYYY